MQDKSMPVKLRVLKPVTEAKIESKSAPRLETLRGKTICEVWATGHWSAHLTFPVIRELLQKRFPGLKFVPYTELPQGHTWGYPIPLGKIGEVFKIMGCDAVLLGNGG